MQDTSRLRKRNTRITRIASKLNKVSTNITSITAQFGNIAHTNSEELTTKSTIPQTSTITSYRLPISLLLPPGTSSKHISEGRRRQLRRKAISELSKNQDTKASYQIRSFTVKAQSLSQVEAALKKRNKQDRQLRPGTSNKNPRHPLTSLS